MKKIYIQGKDPNTLPSFPLPFLPLPSSASPSAPLQNASLPYLITCLSHSHLSFLTFPFSLFFSTLFDLITDDKVIKEGRAHIKNGDDVRGVIIIISFCLSQSLVYSSLLIPLKLHFFLSCPLVSLLVLTIYIFL